MRAGVGKLTLASAPIFGVGMTFKTCGATGCRFQLFCGAWRDVLLLFGLYVENCARFMSDDRSPRGGVQFAGIVLAPAKLWHLGDSKHNTTL